MCLYTLNSLNSNKPSSTQMCHCILKSFNHVLYNSNVPLHLQITQIRPSSTWMCLCTLQPLKSGPLQFKCAFTLPIHLAPKTLSSLHVMHVIKELLRVNHAYFAHSPRRQPSSAHSYTWWKQKDLYCSKMLRLVGQIALPLWDAYLGNTGVLWPRFTRMEVIRSLAKKQRWAVTIHPICILLCFLFTLCFKIFICSCGLLNQLSIFGLNIVLVKKNYNGILKTTLLKLHMVALLQGLPC